MVGSFVFGTQKNRLIVTVLLSTNNIDFGWELRKIFFNYFRYGMLLNMTVILSEFWWGQAK